MSLTIPLWGEAGALAQMAACSTCLVRGIYANRPNPGMAGRLYFVTDANILLFDDGTQWQAIGPTFSGIGLPVASQYTWLNQRSTIVDFSTGPMVMAAFGNNDGSNHLSAQLFNAPAPPYGIFVQLACNLPAPNPDSTGTNAEVGIVAYDSVVGKGILWGPSWRLSGGMSMEYQLFTTVDTAADGPYPNTPSPHLGGYISLGFEDDAVNRRILYGSPDNSRFGVIHSEARNANGGTGAAFTPNQIGIGINPCGPSIFQCSVTVYSVAVVPVAHG